uniref:Solute carrier family 35 member F5 n=1 Tax=Daphnia galeata TaxID=27404 RepID=A0A8J2RXU4_9CRUS|nr:unnamed protein product [Daphnia galeata]
MAVALSEDETIVVPSSLSFISCTSLLSKSQRLLLGLLLLLFVDVIWVLSSELTKFIFQNAEYDKPFFTTYFKTSFFMIYLTGFIFAKSWREQCVGHSSEYQQLKQDVIEDPEDPSSVLSGPVFVPMKNGEEPGQPIVINENTEESSSRSVRFNGVVEVRELSPNEAVDALMARLSYSASIRAEVATRRCAEKLSSLETMKVAATFSLLWFLGNYSYQAALSHTEAGLVNVLSSSSSLFTLMLAACLPSGTSDRFTLTKFIAVVFSIAGVVLVSLSDLKVEQSIPVGAGWALAGSMCYAAYLVLLKRRVDHEDKMSIPMFFGFVGLINTVVMWPSFFILHATKLEIFVWPTQQQWLYIALNGLIGTVLSEFLWLWGCFLTSSLIATLAMSLTIPLSMLADVAVKHISYPFLFYIGSIPMFLSFFAVTLLSHWEEWDPVAQLLNRIVDSCRSRNRNRSMDYTDDGEQRESLIDQPESNSE